MLSIAECAKISDVIRSVSTSTEARFLDIGNRLGMAVETIGTLTQTFDLLANELKGENLRDATHELSRIISRVTALARAHDDERGALEQLAELTSRIQHRVGQMGKAVNGIGMLAINARIEAVSIGNAALDFASFTTDVRRTLGLAQTSLDHFTSELGGVGNRLRTAAASQLALAQHQKAAIHSIPGRLAASVSAITDRSKRAVAAASAVTQKSRQVGQRISSAVMALQIGDTTRQRLEHVEYALDILSAIMAPPSDGRAGRHGDWTALTAAQRHALAGLCCRLQSAQLLDAADEFDQEVRQILSSIQQLSGDARDIMQLGNAAVGASNNQQGTFLGEVEAQVGEVSELLDALGTARREADQVAVSVTEATIRLVSHTSTLKSLEDDIRIMGLNTTLKCGRLGDVGKPLIVIAQELRVYANQIAVEAGAITINLDSIVATAGSLSSGQQEEKSADVSAIATGMASSVSRLRTAGESLADAVTILARDTAGVAELLGDTVARAAMHDDISKIMRQAAAELAKSAADSDGRDGVLMPETGRMLDLFMGSYTMDRERMVHARYSNGHVGAVAAVVRPSAPARAAPADLEDVFF